MNRKLQKKNYSENETVDTQYGRKLHSTRYVEVGRSTPKVNDSNIHELNLNEEGTNQRKSKSKVNNPSSPNLSDDNDDVVDRKINFNEIKNKETEINSIGKELLCRCGNHSLDIKCCDYSFLSIYDDGEQSNFGLIRICCSCNIATFIISNSIVSKVRDSNYDGLSGSELMGIKLYLESLNLSASISYSIENRKPFKPFSVIPYGTSFYNTYSTTILKRRFEEHGFLKTIPEVLYNQIYKNIILLRAKKMQQMTKDSAKDYDYVSTYISNLILPQPTGTLRKNDLKAKSIEDSVQIEYSIFD